MKKEKIEQILRILKTESKNLENELDNQFADYSDTLFNAGFRRGLLKAINLINWINHD